MLRYAADRATVFVLAAASVTFFAQWFIVGEAGVLLGVSVLLALPVAAIAHNHNHLPMWHGRVANVVTDYVLTFLYGLPKLSWLTIHNRSHHAHGNRPGADCTSTHQAGDRPDLLGLVAYVPSCTPGFWREHGRALAALWREDRRQLAYHASQILFLWGTLALAFAVDWEKALLFVVVPQQAGIACITVFNYCQHVRTDHESRYGVARNFTGRILNAYLFNVGYHTIHHLKPTLHWSLAPEAQGRFAGEIDPSLQQPSFWRFFLGLVAARRVIP